ncbi:MAG: VanZ family protein [Lachnospiraceae bacterium]|nr:VanZ family protein [Lachnospiraceae bacterium]
MLLGYLLLIFPAIALLSALLYLPIYLIGRKCGRKHTPAHHIAVYALIGCCCSLAYLTILWYYPNITFHPEYHFLNLVPFIWLQETYLMGTTRMIEQLLLNIAMFLPYGFLLPCVFTPLRKLRWQILVVIATTTFIETIQYFIGRSADIDDVIMNTIGGVLGYLCFIIAEKLQTVISYKKRIKDI